MFSLSRVKHYEQVFYNKYFLPTVINRRKSRLRNKNRDFSILCGNCMGGIISHQLNVPFLSPTVNIMMSQSDFYKLVLNLNDYLGYEFEEIPRRSFPRGRLNDVVVNFTHFKTFNEAVDTWKRRTERIKFDNLWVIATDRDGITEKDIASLMDLPCRGLVVFTAKKYDYPYCFQLKQFEKQGQIGDILQQTIYGKRYLELYFDYVGWLNSDDKVVEHFRLRD